MSEIEQSLLGESENMEAQWHGVYTIGGIAAVLTLIGIVLDMIVGISTGGNLSALPQTAVDRFTELQGHPLLGLYHLDLLNTIIQILSIPTYFALYAVHRKVNKPYALLALIIFLVGTTIFVTTNTALPMLELSRKYAVAAESHKVLLAAAGEAMLANGAHGSASVFIGFVLPTIAAFIMSCVMLSGKVFGRLNSYMGIFGNALMLVYLVLVTFIPGVQSMATAFAMPGGLLLLAWMVMLTIKLFQISRK